MNELSLVYKQPFIKVGREICGNEQKYIEKQYHLYLYETKIITPVKTFRLADILDVSYRGSKEKFGTLYLHSTEGVFPFYVSPSPENFIQLIKKLQGKINN